MNRLDEILNDSGSEVEYRTHGGESPFASAARSRQGKKSVPAKKTIMTVGRSMEFRRIEALPRRKLDLEAAAGFDLSWLKQPNGTMNLRPIQAAAMVDAAHMNGGFFPIGVGQGKTLLTLLLPIALDSTNTVLFVPTQLKKQLRREIDTIYSKHFLLVMDLITVVAYSEISQAKNADILDQIKPDLIIADEAHNFRHRSASKTKRFLRYMKDNPGCRFVALSGTITSRSLNDYAHLIELALRKSSPLPRGYREVQDWAGALDVKPEYEVAPGALERFCEPGETPREGFRRRLIETQGVVASSEDEVGASLVIQRLRVKVPPPVFRLYSEVKKSWSIEGEEFSDILTRTRVLRQIACGFYYRWVWPDGEKDWEWLEARANWNKAVREKLKQSRPGLDSPLLLANAAERAAKIARAKSLPIAGSIKAFAKLDELEGAIWEQGVEPWLAWKRVKDRKTPPTEAIWVDDFLLRDLQKRGSAVDEPTIVWYEHVAVGEALARLTGWPIFDAGTDASASREKIIIASIAVQGTGKNLQHYSNNLFASLPPNGTIFQQTIARTHRPGQQADVVTAGWYGHTIETEDAMVKIQADANYQLQTTGAPQKVLYASHVNEDD